MRTDDIRKLAPGQIITMLGSGKVTVLDPNRPTDGPAHANSHRPRVDPDLFQVVDEHGVTWSFLLRGLTDIQALS